MAKAPAHANIGPKMSDEDRAAMQRRSDMSVAAASPETFRAGARWYPRANTEANQVAMGINPSPIKGMEGLTQQHRAHADQYDVAQHGAANLAPLTARLPGHTQENVDRASAQIARLSPAMPAGMTWANRKGDPMNSAAAHEVNHEMSPHQFGLLENEDRAYRGVGRAKSGVLAAERAHGAGSPEHVAAQTAHVAAVANYDKVRAPINPEAPKAQQKTAARAALKGMAVTHASNGAILAARDIGTGAIPRETPGVKGQYGLGTVKIANFAGAVADPSSQHHVAIDFKTGDINAGARYPTDAPRGLEGQGTYDVHRQVIQNTAKKFGVTPSAAQAVGWVHDDTVSQAEAGKAQKGLGVGVKRTGQPIVHALGPRSIGMPEAHRNALTEPPNAPGPGTKKMTGFNTAGRNRHGDDL